MSIHWERNAYLSAVKEKLHFNSENKIFNYAEANLQFKYVDVNVQEFNQKYSAEGWIGRKVIALPAAIWSGIIKTIYHLVTAILLGVIVHSVDSKYLKAQLFYIARDLQKCFGWLATLFNDRYGQYHIQESEFHKSCYDCFSPIKQSAINRVMSDSSSFQNLSYDLRNDEDVVTAALNGCTSSEEAKKVISSANYDAKNSKKVALALVKIDPTQLGQLSCGMRNDEDVVAVALNGCTSSEQAKKVISSVRYNAKDSKKVALALVKIDPTQLGELNYGVTNDEDIVIEALNNCKSSKQAKQTISSLHSDAKNSKKVAFVLVKIDPTLLGQLL